MNPVSMRTAVRLIGPETNKSDIAAEHPGDNGSRFAADARYSAEAKTSTS